MIRLCVALVAAVMACGSAFAQGRLPSPALNNPTLTGGTVDGAVIGGTTPAAAAFTDLSATGAVSGAGITSLLAPYAPLASPTFTGTVTGAAGLFSGTLGVTGAATFGSTTPISDATLATQISAPSSGQSYYAANKNGAYGALFGYNTNSGFLGGVGGMIRMVTADPLWVVVNSSTLASEWDSTGLFTAKKGITTNGNFNLNDVTAPQNNVEMNLLGFSGNTIPLSGSQTYQMFNAKATISGSSTADQAFVGIQTVDNYSSAGAPNGSFALQVSAVAGVGANGSHTAFQAIETINGSGITAGSSYVSGAFLSGASVSVGGTGPGASAAGFLYGFYPQCILKSGATNWNLCAGGEIDVGVNAGASANDVTGLSIVLVGSHAVHGSDNADSGLVFGSQGGLSTGWDWGIRYGGAAPWPFVSSATMIGIGAGATTAVTAAFGIDFSRATFSTAFLKSTGFLVDGSGNVTGASYKVASTAGVSCAANTVALATLVVTGGIVTHC